MTWQAEIWSMVLLELFGCIIQKQTSGELNNGLAAPLGGGPYIGHIEFRRSSQFGVSLILISQFGTASTSPLVADFLSDTDEPLPLARHGPVSC